MSDYKRSAAWQSLADISKDHPHARGVLGKVMIDHRLSAGWQAARQMAQAGALTEPEAMTADHMARFMGVRHAGRHAATKGAQYLLTLGVVTETTVTSPRRGRVPAWYINPLRVAALAPELHDLLMIYGHYRRAYLHALVE